ncbi:RCKP-type rubredoxin-like domain-containing protein [Desulfotomaculum copahuensis]|uniref:Radical SAM protein n=1 Tax=Desulfotomaculum copahuensis TaxID=1838280 RepID=A0A1B7LE74_9FIRM|nr:radical SAM protein [Desulfotomaculum copahuensis]OAT81408.1 radical SAM protein [Desulfotomaculum copahuensis]
MAVYKCAECGNVVESRCKPGKCKACGAPKDKLVKEETKK